jgi:hypothetical protein
MVVGITAGRLQDLLTPTGSFKPMPASVAARNKTIVRGLRRTGRAGLDFRHDQDFTDRRCRVSLTSSLAYAQNAAPGGGAVTSPANPEINAAANAKPAVDPSTSGSGTSTSGGKDANGDGGRDKMPNSNLEVRPPSQQNSGNGRPGR